jgi:hypothetical protein
MTAALAAEPETAAVPYSQIPYIPRRWLWDGYVPVATPVVYAAAGGTGKGMLMSAVLARVVLGLPWPGEDPAARHAPRRAVWISGPGEDDQWEDIAPRLRAALASAAAEFGLDSAAAAAALELVYDLSQWEDDTPVTLPADCGRLADEIASLNATPGPPVGLVVADSLSALLSEGFTIDSRQGARRVMGRLGRFARAADVSLAVLHHLTKDGKVAGSPAVLDAVRLAFVIVRDPDRPEVRTITRHKANASAAAPQQYVITGEGPAVHAVFTSSAGARAERVRQARAAAAPEPRTDGRSNLGSFRARLRASAPSPAAEPHRCLRRAQQGDGPALPGELLADGVPVDAALRAAADDAGAPLEWQSGPSGMRVATARRPDGWRVTYGVYPVQRS